MSQPVQQFALSVLQHCPVAVLVADDQARVIWTNTQFDELLGINLVGERLDSLPERGMQWLLEPGEQTEISLDQCPRWIRVSRKAVENHTILFYEDVTETHRLRQEREQEQYGTDALTGLLNHRALLQILEPQIARSRRYQNPLTIVYMCVKPFLSEAGKVSQVKDHTLVALSQLFKDQIRWADQIGRFREQAFLLILPETHYEDALKLTEKLQQKILRLNQTYQKGQDKIAVTFGISQWQKGDDTLRLLHRAEQCVNEDN